MRVSCLQRSYKDLQVLCGVGLLDAVTNALTQPRARQRLRQTGQLRREFGARNTVGWTPRLGPSCHSGTISLSSVPAESFEYR
jgi:hypothetical protein